MTKKNNKIQRAAIISNKMMNSLKLKKVKTLYNCGKYFVKQYIDKLWPIKHTLQHFADAKLYNLISNKVFTTKFLQICCKQAIGIIQSIQQKIQKKEHLINRLDPTKDATTITNIQNSIEKLNNGKPQLKNYVLELNANIMKIELQSQQTKHNDWITLSKIVYSHDRSNPWRIYIPFKRTCIFNKWLAKGKLSQYLQIYQDGTMKCVFTLLKPKIKATTKKNITIGCDIGVNSVYALNTGIISPKDHLGRDQNYYINKLLKCKSNSKNYKKLITSKIQYVNWAINQVNLSNVKSIKIEDLKGMPNTGRTHFWCYRQILNKLTSRCEELNINVIKIAPAFTSQRCSKCGWVHSKNRGRLGNKKSFKCLKCNFSIDADINAAKNIHYLDAGDRITSPPLMGHYWHKI